MEFWLPLFYQDLFSCKQYTEEHNLGFRCITVDELRSVCPGVSRRSQHFINQLCWLTPTSSALGKFKVIFIYIGSSRPAWAT